MITDLLFNIGLAIVGAAWDLVPTWTIEAPSLQPFVYEMTRWDGIVPITELRLMMTALLIFFGASIGIKLLIKFVDWIMDIIP